MNIRLAGIVNDSIVDGPGFRLAVFTQGCQHHCEGCHNPGAQDAASGHDDDTERIALLMKNNPLLDGLTLTGGEPFLQPEASAEIARCAKQLGLNVWTYTGYTFEEIVAEGRDDWRALLEQTDVLVDGRFEAKARTLELRFRGSRNQRLIDVKRSLAEGTIVEVPLQ